MTTTAPGLTPLDENSDEICISIKDYRNEALILVRCVTIGERRNCIAMPGSQDLFPGLLDRVDELLIHTLKKATEPRNAGAGQNPSAQ